METILLTLVIISVVATVCIMLMGAATMTKKEPDSRKSNKMMRARVISQGVTVLLIVLYVLARNAG